MGWTTLGQHLLASWTMFGKPSDSVDCVESPRPMEANSPAVQVAPRAGGSGDSDTDTDRLVSQLLEQGRYALLLRPQIANSLSADQRDRARLAFARATSFVSQGKVEIEPWRTEEIHSKSEHTVDDCCVYVEPLYLDCVPITNLDFLQFVGQGGYEQQALWQAGVWPRVRELVDRSGHAGPRYWSSGHFPEGLAEHPVVGVSWFEADAYARWAGKRLPSDAEWIKAASWPVTAPEGESVPRKYPWGDTLDVTRVNLWASQLSTTAPVSEFAEGDSVGGIRQLIGNVWEWMANSFVLETANSEVELVGSLKSLRGGAFDTYFANQVTCQFQSGDAPLARKRNIGFRCATSCCDVSVVTAESIDDSAQSRRNGSELFEVGT